MRTAFLGAALWVAIPAAAQDVTVEPAASVLAQLVAELDARNPELIAARREIEVRAARVAPAGAPPDPVLSVGFMGGFRRPPFFPSDATPDAFRQIAVTQALPFPGTLPLRRRVATADVEAARWSAEQTRVRLAADLKSAYADYVLAARTLAIVARSKHALEQVRSAAEARFSVGKATQQDVLRAQLEISILLERMTVLERDRAVRQADVNRVLARAPDTPIPVADPVEVAGVDLALESLQARAIEQSPALRREAAVVARTEQTLALTRREQRPDFGVRLTTQKLVGRMPWMYGLDLMVTVPVFWGRTQQPLIAEAAAEVGVARSILDDARLEMAAEVARQHAALTASRTLVQLYADSVLPQARLTLESSSAAYEVGGVDFLTVVTNFVAVLNYEVSLEEQRARVRQSLARLEPLTGLLLLR